MTEYPWPPGSATGVGSYPGNDMFEALRVVFGELPELPHLPELPARGVGADLIGRSAALLVDMPVEVHPSGWRFTARPGGDLRRARDFLASDLYAIEETYGYAGALKIQVAGVWTLAAGIEMRGGERVLADAGAIRDLVESFAEGVAGHVGDVRRRLPDATLLVQLDEPALPAVLAGAVLTASGLRTLPPIGAEVAEWGVHALIAAAGGALPVVHCCAAGVPIALLRQAGAQAISVDLRAVESVDEAAIGEAVEAGTGFFFGIVPGEDAELSDAATTVEPLRALWRRLGFTAERLPEQVVVTPACGLAGASPWYAREALAHCRAAALVLEGERE